MEENKVGRPTVMTDETLNKLENAFIIGASDKMACFLANISEGTLYKYQNENPEFIKRKEFLKNQLKYQARAKIQEAIFNEDKPDKLLERFESYLPPGTDKSQWAKEFHKTRQD